MRSLQILPELHKAGLFTVGKVKHFLFVLLFPDFGGCVWLFKPSAVL